jgi:hypothetical protein
MFGYLLALFNKFSKLQNGGAQMAGKVQGGKRKKHSRIMP